MALIVLGLGLLTYSISQICSLFFRSGIIALAMGSFCSIMVCLWAVLMGALQVPLWFAVLPIPLIALWASWLRAPDWLSERTRWRARLKLLLSLAFPLAAVLVATACYRVYEIPVVRLILPEANHPQPPSDDARETLRLYHEAWSLWEPANSEEGIAEFLEASRREHCWFPNVYDLHRQSRVETTSDEMKNVETLVTYPTRLANFVLNSCDPLESDGNLDAAFERHMAVLRFARHLYYRGDLRRQRGADAVEALALERLGRWAANPGQNADGIRTALQRLDQEYFVFSPSREYEMLDDYLARHDILEFDETAWEKSGAGWQEKAVFQCMHVLLPCEHARVKRVSAACMASQFQRIRSARRLLAENGCVRDTVDPFHERNQRWAKTTPLLWSAGPNLIYFHRGGQGEAAPENYQNVPRHGSAMVLSNEQEVWSLGWSFPIP